MDQDSRKSPLIRSSIILESKHIYSSHVCFRKVFFPQTGTKAPQRQDCVCVEDQCTQGIKQEKAIKKTTLFLLLSISSTPIVSAKSVKCPQREKRLWRSGQLWLCVKLSRSILDYLILFPWHKVKSSVPDLQVFGSSRSGSVIISTVPVPSTIKKIVRKKLDFNCVVTS